MPSLSHDPKELGLARVRSAIELNELCRKRFLVKVAKPTFRGSQIFRVEEDHPLEKLGLTQAVFVIALATNQIVASCRHQPLKRSALRYRDSSGIVCKELREVPYHQPLSRKQSKLKNKCSTARYSKKSLARSTSTDFL